MRLLRTLGIVIGLAAAVVLSVWIGIGLLLDPAKLKASLAQSVQQTTGRALTVTGDLHLRFGLSPDVEVDGIALANIDGGSQKNMLTAKSLRARLALLPLLSGDAQIESLTIVEPDILLERAADGTPNWQFTRQHRPASPDAANSSGGNGGAHHRIAISAVAIQGGQLVWRPGQGAPFTVGIDHGDLAELNPGGALSLDMSGTHAGQVFAVKARAGSLDRLRGGPVSALAGPWPLTVDASSGAATLHIDGGFLHPDQLRGYEFRVTGNAPDLSVVNAFMNGFIGDIGLPALQEINLSAVLTDDGQGAIRSSQVSLHVGASDLGRAIPGLTIKQAVLSAPGPGQLAQLSLDGLYAGAPLRLAGTAVQPDSITPTAPVQISLDAEAAGSHVSAHGTVPPSRDGTGLDVTVAARVPDLAALAPLAGRPLPSVRDLALDAHAVDAGMRLNGVALSSFVLASSLGDLAGSGALNWAPRPNISGNFTSKTLDLDAIIAALSTQPAPFPAAPAPTEPSQAAASFPARGKFATLLDADADVSLKVADLVAGGQHWNDLDTHLRLADGRLALNPFRATAAEGILIGGASIDASADPPPVAITLRSPAVSAAVLSAALGFPSGASGTMQVDAQLNGAGATRQALLATSGGHLGIGMVNGQVDASLLRGLLGPALDAAGVPMPAGSSKLRCLALRMDFSHGLGTFKALAIDATALSLDGDGTIDFGGDTLDLHVRPLVRLGPTQVAAPVALTGPFDALKAALDPVLGGRVGISIGGGGDLAGACAAKLALARGGLAGPMPAAPPPANGLQLQKIKKPKDLLQGLFH